MGMPTADVRVIPFETLPQSAIARQFVGEAHEATVTFLLVDAEPDRGPAPHRHPYEEIFIVLEGRATFVFGDESRVVSSGEVVVVPAGRPHAFTNTGDGPLRQIDIHLSDRFGTEWLEEGAG